MDFNLESNLDLSKWSVDINNTELLGEWLRQFVTYVIDVRTDVKRPRYLIPIYISFSIVIFPNS